MQVLSRIHLSPPCHSKLLYPREICTECFERLTSDISLGGKILHFASFIHIFLLIPFLEGRICFGKMQWKWLGLKNNVAEFLTTDSVLETSCDKSFKIIFREQNAKYVVIVAHYLEKKITCGIPQGSVLGPLFIIMMIFQVFIIKNVC